MKYKQVVIKNQKFDIRKTINPFKCDCKECDFMNCPKNNYCRDTKKYYYSFDELWKEWSEKVLKDGLTYDYLTDLVCDCVEFPKGLYWEFDYTIFGEIKAIILRKLKRSGTFVYEGRIYMVDGKIIDYFSTERNLKVAEKISKLIKKTINKLTEVQDESRTN